MPFIFHTELPLKEVGGIDDGEDEDGGEVDGEDGVEEPPLEHQRHLQACVRVACIGVAERPETIVDSRHVWSLVKAICAVAGTVFHLPVCDDILGENSVGLHHQVVWGELHH